MQVFGLIMFPWDFHNGYRQTNLQQEYGYIDDIFLLCWMCHICDIAFTRVLAFILTVDSGRHINSNWLHMYLQLSIPSSYKYIFECSGGASIIHTVSIMNCTICHRNICLYIAYVWSTGIWPAIIFCLSSGQKIRGTY